MRPKLAGASARTLIVLGSGGHTAEMLMMLGALDQSKYSPRVYVVAATDAMSQKKAEGKEHTWAGGGSADSKTSAHQAANSHQHFHVRSIPRSREVGQSYLTSVLTTLRSLVFAASLVWQERPELVLVNGPGTCIPICAAAFALRFLGLRDSRVAYVESIARTHRLSLSAKILYHSRVADVLFVQWEGLAKSHPRAVYAGRLY
ncbi:MAG: hypothetical protein WDW36_010156 [Sanguina aurantia]